MECSSGRVRRSAIDAGSILIVIIVLGIVLGVWVCVGVSVCLLSVHFYFKRGSR